MDTTHSLNLSNQGISQSGLFIEQEPYGPSDGYLSRAGMYLVLFNILEDEEQEEPDCTDDCTTIVYVYRYDLTLNYKLYVSRGVIGVKTVQETIYIQKVKVSMQEEVALDYPNFGETSARWLGDKVWGRDGREITPPGYTASIDKVVFDQPVYGTLLLSYKINRDCYSVRLTKRAEAEENKYSSVAYAIYKGGPTWKILEPPPGAEDTEHQCTGGGGGLDIPDPDPDEYPPYAPNVDAEKVIDYCTGEVESDSSVH